MWQLAFQCLQSYVGIIVNKTADALTADAHQIDELTVFFRQNSEGGQFLRYVYLKRQPHQGADDGRPPRANSRSIRKKVASLLHHLQGNCADRSSSLYRRELVGAQSNLPKLDNGRCGACASGVCRIRGEARNLRSVRCHNWSLILHK